MSMNESLLDLSEPFGVRIETPDQTTTFIAMALHMHLIEGGYLLTHTEARSIYAKTVNGVVYSFSISSELDCDFLINAQACENTNRLFIELRGIDVMRLVDSLSVLESLANVKTFLDKTLPSE